MSSARIGRPKIAAVMKIGMTPSEREDDPAP
jgi:hypothetical protein